MRLKEIVYLDEATDYQERHNILSVNHDGNNIREIDNPSEAVQMAAVKQNPYAIQYINNPTEKVQLYVVGKNGMYITMIEQPLNDVVMRALRDPTFYTYEYMYNKFVKDYFKDNNLLLKKWLRYGEAMRDSE